MSAEQQSLFEATLAEGEASLLARLEELQGHDGPSQDAERSTPVAQSPGAA